MCELVGGGFGMLLKLSEENGAMKFESENFFLRLFGRKITIPNIFTPGKTIVKQTACENNTFEFCLSVTHPVFGLTYYQVGIFEEERVFV